MRLSKKQQEQVARQPGKVTEVNRAALGLSPETTCGQPASPSRRSKYRNKRVFRTPDGLIVGEDHPGPKEKVADSRKEYRRLLELRAEQAAGAIQWLRTQVGFKLTVNGHPICRYRADFVYIRGGRQVVEDCKGMRTDVYKLKRALMKAVLGIDILET